MLATTPEAAPMDWKTGFHRVGLTIAAVPVALGIIILPFIYFGSDHQGFVSGLPIALGLIAFGLALYIVSRAVGWIILGFTRYDGPKR
jgi:hypothetical protein